MKLVIAEKPSVARDLARVLGVHGKGGGALVGEGYTITWCIGHLVELEEPHAYDPSWKRWSWPTLPMVPERFRLRPAKRTIAQWRIVRDLLARRDFEVVINACDAGREGELIFRYVYERAKSRLPIMRLWISSLTPDAIRRGFRELGRGRDYEALAAAARCRSEADWLVGINATRAMTLASRKKDGGHPAKPGRRERGGLYSIGRVQTPTLALLVEREQEILHFIPRDFWELTARATQAGETFAARWTSPEGGTRLASAALASALEARVRAATPDRRLEVVDVTKKEIVEPPPQLFDLTALQQAANRRFGFSAERTLQAAQELYERHKLITYPRTSSRYLTEADRDRLPGLIEAFARHPQYGPFASAIGAPLPITRRIVDDAKVGDHPAIIPTGVFPPALPEDPRKVFDLIVRRFLAAFHPAARFLSTEILLATARASRPKRDQAAREAIMEALPPPPDRFVARGRVVLERGWQAVEPPKSPSEQTLPDVTVGERLDAKLAVTRGRTEPPRRHSDASLLGAMETAGRRVEDEALREAMKDRGLGTPATRASIIETLIQREYLRRERKNLRPTEKGIALIERLPVPTLRSADLTGEWEARLLRIARGVEPASVFMADVAAFVRDAVEKIAGGRIERRPPRKDVPLQDVLQHLVCPRCRREGIVPGRQAWGCAHWRTGCGFTVPFVFEGRSLTPRELGDLLSKGKTRKAAFARGKGRIHLEDGLPTLRLDP